MCRTSPTCTQFSRSEPQLPHRRTPSPVCERTLCNSGAVARGVPLSRRFGAARLPHGSLSGATRAHLRRHLGAARMPLGGNLGAMSAPDAGGAGPLRRHPRPRLTRRGRGFEALREGVRRAKGFAARDLVDLVDRERVELPPVRRRRSAGAAMSTAAREATANEGAALGEASTPKRQVATGPPQRLRGCDTL